MKKLPETSIAAGEALLLDFLPQRFDHDLSLFPPRLGDRLDRVRYERGRGCGGDPQTLGDASICARFASESATGPQSLDEISLLQPVREPVDTCSIAMPAVDWGKAPSAWAVCVACLGQVEQEQWGRFVSPHFRAFPAWRSTSICRASAFCRTSVRFLQRCQRSRTCLACGAPFVAPLR